LESMNRIKALIVVDMQRDFCPGGALALEGGDTIVETINKLIAGFEKSGLPIAFTRDWHPRNHRSFKDQGGPWPPHCMQGTPGAEFHLSLRVPAGAIMILKGTHEDLDAYSGFQGTDLAERLRKAGVGELFVAGLATDYCVKNTILDALGQGFKANVITDCVSGVNIRKTDSADSLGSMVAMGATEVTSTDVLKMLRRRVAMSSSS
jgi:nicotinamidase/pyrazinamidase